MRLGQSLAGTWSLPSGLSRLARAPQEPPVSASTLLGPQPCLPYPAPSRGLWALNSGPQAYATSTLPVQLSVYQPEELRLSNEPEKKGQALRIGGSKAVSMLGSVPSTTALNWSLVSKGSHACSVPRTVGVVGSKGTYPAPTLQGLHPVGTISKDVTSSWGD